MADKTVLILKGLPASGKSTHARELVLTHPEKWKRVNKDDLRAMFDGGKYSQAREAFVLQARDALILSALMAGYSVIVDDTNLNPKHEQQIRDLIAGLPNVRVQLDERFLGVSLEECIKRDQKRQNYVGEKVIRRMYNEWLRPKGTHTPKLIENAPFAVICDLDGTLAHLNGRDPYNAATCEEDGLDVVIARTLSRERQSGVTILLVSGREARYEAETRRWLEKHDVLFDHLWMRPTGDFRDDRAIKREIYEREIKGKYNVLYVLDDRNKVVDMWRNELGLKVLQVADGDF